MRKRHKEAGVRSNDELIAELASAKRRSQGSAFCFAPPAPHSPILHQGLIPRVTSRSTVGRKS
ncbi:hypothetical protein BCR43DRAFT_519454 [Syncephalastrum racemosum]|uniref:Uncharacterized protein n=1 Tax=Syncephalastrum racemosum TaxID=13706 RepID=A0A1X2GYU6_SYNRA|nr:hypothetical protein BCR43DRAFT_519454 [Syncephalastrum racemosum]